MPPLPRGTCPGCGADVALRKRGEVREHVDARTDKYPCPDSGRMAGAQAPPAAFRPIFGRPETGLR